MDDTDTPEEKEDQLPYVAAEEIDPNALNDALCSLHSLGDDPFLRMQAFNLAVVDQYLTELEYQVLRKLFDDERTPVPETVFLSAQSQMWIFAAYELLRTWRQRALDMIKWAESGGLKKKLEALEKDEGYRHFGREHRKRKINPALARPKLQCLFVGVTFPGDRERRTDHDRMSKARIP